MSAQTKIGFYKRNSAVEFIAYGEPVEGQPAPKPTYFADETACRAMFIKMVGGSSTTGIRPVEFVPSTVPGVVAWTVYKHV